MSVEAPGSPLVSIPVNPAPPGGVAGLIVAGGGVPLRYARWPAPPGPRRGTICLFQGRGEAIEKYFETIGDLMARGFAVATLDWRGQGGSARLLDGRPRHGHVESFADHRRDLETFLREVVLPDCPPPFFALTHSMGGLIVAGAVASGRVRFERIAMMAPMFALSRRLAPSPRLLMALSGSAMFTGLGDRAIPGQEPYGPGVIPFENNPLTSDAGRFNRNRMTFRAAPQLVVSPATFGWMHAAIAAMRDARRASFAAAIRDPLLVVAAGDDSVVDTPSAVAFARRVDLGSAVVIAGARHEILMESDGPRGEAFAALDAFLASKDGRLPAAR